MIYIKYNVFVADSKSFGQEWDGVIFVHHRTLDAHKYNIVCR